MHKHFDPQNLLAESDKVTYSNGKLDALCDHYDIRKPTGNGDELRTYLP